MHSALLHNTVVLLQGASCLAGSPAHLRALHGTGRLPILASLLRQQLGADTGKRTVIAVQGRKDLEPTVAQIREAFGEAAGPLGTTR